MKNMEKKMRKLYSVFLVFLFCVSAFEVGCSKKEASEEILTKEIIPELYFQTKENNDNYRFNAARNFTFDDNGNLYIFDYMENYINKYDKNGEFITSFGKQGKGEDEFEHLMAIKVIGDKLLALDSIAVLTFSLDGEFLSKTPFKGKAMSDQPRIFEDGHFVGDSIVSDEIKRVLSYRDPEGNELQRISFYDLREFFPDLEEGKDFFLNDSQTRLHLYDFAVDGGVLWAATDKFAVYKYKDGASDTLVTGPDTPLPFPEDQREELTAKQTKMKETMPMLHSYVPQYYQLLYHLFVGEDQDIWLYVHSWERTGFVRYTPDGKEKGFYTVQADFDMARAILQVYKNNLYFMVPSRKEVKIYRADY
jgi:hypothetical protein